MFVVVVGCWLLLLLDRWCLVVGCRGSLLLLFVCCCLMLFVLKCRWMLSVVVCCRLLFFYVVGVFVFVRSGFLMLLFSGIVGCGCCCHVVLLFVVVYFA